MKNKKPYQPKSRHDQLRTRIEKDKTKYDRKALKQLDIFDQKRKCDCFLDVGDCYCELI